MNTPNATTLKGESAIPKQAYALNQNKAKLKESPETWITFTIVVMNLLVSSANLYATF